MYSILCSMLHGVRSAYRHFDFDIMTEERLGVGVSFHLVTFFWLISFTFEPCMRCSLLGWPMDGINNILCDVSLFRVSPWNVTNMRANLLPQIVTIFASQLKSSNKFHNDFTPLLILSYSKEDKCDHKMPHLKRSKRVGDLNFYCFLNLFCCWWMNASGKRGRKLWVEVEANCASFKWKCGSWLFFDKQKYVFSSSWFHLMSSLSHMLWQTTFHS